MNETEINDHSLHLKSEAILNSQEIAENPEGGEMSLHVAVAMNSVEKCSSLLASGAQIDAVNDEGNSSFHLACKLGYSRIVSLLLANGANLAETNKEGCFPLHISSENGNVETTNLLLDNGANINEKDESGWTPLHFSVEFGHIELVSLLLNRGADVELKNKFGWTALHMASRNGDEEILSVLLKIGASVNETNDDGSSALILSQGNSNISTLLLQYGASTNSKNNFGVTPLILATKKGQLELARRILDTGADLHEKNNEGWTAFHFACYCGDLPMVSLLLDRGANINEPMKTFTSPLQLACNEGHLEVIEHLLDRGADVDAKDTYGWTAFHLACKKGNTEIAKCLVEKGIDLNIPINVKRRDGTTSLHLASENGNSQLASFLIEKGANINDKNKNGFTALIFASDSGHLDLVTLLVEKGADLNAKEHFGRSPIQFACIQGHAPVVSFFLMHHAKLFGEDRDPRVPCCPDRHEMEITDTKETINYRDGWRCDNCQFEGTGKRWCCFSCVYDFCFVCESSDGKSELHLASESGHLNVVNALLEYGVKINSKSLDGKSPLILACEKGHNEVVSRLLEVEREQVLLSKETFDISLRTSIEHCQVSVVSVILQHFTELVPKSQGVIHQNIFFAIKKKQTKIFELLLNCCSSTEFQNQSHSTPLLLACKEGETEMAKLLIQKQANVLVRNRFNEHPYLFVSEHPALEPILSPRDPLLLDACLHYGLPEVEIALSIGANLEGKSPEGLTPLFLCVYLDKLNIALFLLKHTSPSLVLDGKTILDLASSKPDALSAIWFEFVQHKKYIDLIRDSLHAHPEYYDLRDQEDRHIVSLAIPSVMKAINEVMLWFGRFRLLEDRPEHQSATCYVFKAEDQLPNQFGKKEKVALKLMLRKDQFLKEVSFRRDCQLSSDFVISISSQFPSDDSTIASRPDEIQIGQQDSRLANGVLSKSFVESLFVIALPLADRNLFVASKQERFAGNDWDSVRFICSKLIEALDHVHSKGIIHADLKPLNIVRMGGTWKLIDFDACCRIAIDHVGAKSSSAFCPPESIYVDNIHSPTIAAVRSQHHKESISSDYPLLQAHPSFDVWSLGCVFYQLFTDCRMLFQGGQDDNLRADLEAQDNLFSLADWPQSMKHYKLSLIDHPLARNLLSQMTTKDPAKRPSLSRIKQHPFFTGRFVARLADQEPEFDVFLSYRVFSDQVHVEALYNLLTKQKQLKVWWDKIELKDGKNWEVGFCNGLLKSRVFVPFLSRQGLAGFASLTEDTDKCDNVLLEHRLALELNEMGFIEGIFPIIMGEPSTPAPISTSPPEYRVDWRNIFPQCSDKCVKVVEATTCHHMNNQALGTPLKPNRSVHSVMNEMKNMQGQIVDGNYNEKMAEAADRINTLVRTLTSY